MVSIEEPPFRRVRQQSVYVNDWISVIEIDGIRHGLPAKYTVVDRADTVIVLVVFEPSHRTILLMQHRVPTDELSLELPMGAVEPGESPSHAAAREVAEETSLTIDELDEVGWFHPVCGLSAQRANVFVATVSDDHAGVAVSEPIVDDIVSRRVVRVDDLRAFVQRGDITDGFTLSALSIIDARRPALLTLGQ